MKQTLILPDIHGRSFWKAAITEYYDKVDQIVFLGDYADPYSFEGITNQQALDNLRDLVSYSEERDVDSKTIFLLGNHDFHYIIPSDKCRYDSVNASEIEALIKRLHCRMLFLGGSKKHPILFSHAGLTVGWLMESHINVTTGSKNIDKMNVDYINFLWESGNKKTREIFNATSFFRGGNHLFGSPIWADAHEHENDFKQHENRRATDVYQIFAHTFSYPYVKTDKEMITPEFAMLDCAAAFLLQEEDSGRVRSLNKI